MFPHEGENFLIRFSGIQLQHPVKQESFLNKIITDDHMHCWRRRRGPGRPVKPRNIAFWRGPFAFLPSLPDGRIVEGQPIYLTPDEVESFRLVYLEELTQEEAAKRMGISRGTLWRSLYNARKKIAMALAEMRPLVIGP
jgi:predicted DNA-binding protein (UPF0251 family)